MYTFSIKGAKLARKLGGHIAAVVGAAGAAQGATSVPVAALSGPIASGTVLQFSATKSATLTAAAATGATSLTVSALPVALVSTDTAYGGYGASVTIPAVQMMTGNARVRSAEGFGNDEIKVIAASKIGSAGQCRMLGVSQAALAIISGDTLVTTGSGATEVRNLGIDTGRLPHFGIIGKSEQHAGVDEVDAGGGDELIFLPDVVMVADFTPGIFEDGNLQTLDFSYSGQKSGIYKVVNIIERTTAGDFFLPPLGIL